MAELGPAASAFPLVFRKRQDDTGIDPVALLSFGSSEPTPFVTNEGNWRGTYVPSALRAYPFAAQFTDNAGEMTLLVDEASSLVTQDPKDQPFFNAEGSPAQELEKVIEFFRTRAISALQTQKACVALQAAELLTPLRDFAGMDQADLENLYTINTEKLDALSDDSLPGLWQSGALRLAEAQRVSLCHVGWMLRAERASAGISREAPIESLQPDTALSGFLDALSDAQDRDWSSKS